MTNTLESVVLTGVWSGDSALRFSDYSGGAFNPYYGQLGAHVIHGGGHSANNDNSVFIANLNTLRFERVGGPTQLPSDAAYESAIKGGGFPDNDSNPREVEPGVPGSAHTYDCLLTLPPAVCGDALGGLIRPVAGAVGREASRTSGWSHVFTFSDRRWRRWSTNYALSWSPGGTCAYDTTRGVIWPISDGSMAYRASLSLSSRTWTNTAGHPSINAYPDMVYSAYCAHRDVIVVAANGDGESTIRFFWFGAGSGGGARTQVAFSQGSLPDASWGRGSLIYIPELQKLLYWTQRRIDTYYEIDVPADPNAPWSWVARTITGTARPSALMPGPIGSTYKRMDYAPQLKSLIWVTGQSSNTFSFGGRVVCIRIVP
jgi:hypothetical protein